MLGLFFPPILLLLLLFFNIPLLLFHLYIFLCFDPSICYPFPCLFISSIYYLTFLSCSILFLHHIQYLLFCCFIYIISMYYDQI